MSRDRFERQERLFGIDGQRKIENLKVAVVGAGGLGSHIVQQISLLGVGNIAVIDPDIVTISSLNRLIGARHDDAILKTPKVEVAQRVVRNVDPATKFSGVNDTFVSPSGFEEVKSADYVFGCLDHDGPRLVLMELCQAYKRPYFDLATEIPQESPSHLGGRVFFSANGNGCLFCLDLLSPEEIRQFSLSPAQRDDLRKLYGVPRGDLDGSGPSVVTLNGIVASLASTEFLVRAIELREANRLVTFRGKDGKVTLSQDVPDPNCYYCKSVFGLGKEANVERYL